MAAVAYRCGLSRKLTQTRSIGCEKQLLQTMIEKKAERELPGGTCHPMGCYLDLKLKWSDIEEATVHLRPDDATSKVYKRIICLPYLFSHWLPIEYKSHLTSSSRSIRESICRKEDTSLWLVVCFVVMKKHAIHEEDITYAVCLELKSEPLANLADRESVIKRFRRAASCKATRTL